MKEQSGYWKQTLVITHPHYGMIQIQCVKFAMGNNLHFLKVYPVHF